MEVRVTVELLSEDDKVLWSETLLSDVTECPVFESIDLDDGFPGAVEEALDTALLEAGEFVDG
jgi:hypothetical protein